MTNLFASSNKLWERILDWYQELIIWPLIQCLLWLWPELLWLVPLSSSLLDNHDGQGVKDIWWGDWSEAQHHREYPIGASRSAFWWVIHFLPSSLASRLAQASSPRPARRKSSPPSCGCVRRRWRWPSSRPPWPVSPSCVSASSGESLDTLSVCRAVSGLVKEETN